MRVHVVQGEHFVTDEPDAVRAYLEQYQALANR